MNRRTFLAGCSTLLGLAAPGLSGEPTTPDIAGLIEQLGSNRFKEREEAAKALTKIGEKALPGEKRGRCEFLPCQGGNS
ncbi:MAG TPA: hypothetical protein VFA18_17065, partial [Gemmataceae bacterium]|nr:hypothetical protein [Gemmataceae bacterium]